MRSMKYFAKVVLALVIALFFWDVFLHMFVRYPETTFKNGELVPLVGSSLVNRIFPEGYTNYVIKNDIFGTHTQLNPEKETNIFVFGDSFTKATQVNPKDNFVSLINGNFTKYSFVNAGRDGRSIVDNMMFENEYNFSYSYVIIQTNFNDFFRDAFKKTHKYHYDYDENGSIYVVKENIEKKENVLKTEIATKFNYLKELIYDPLQLPKYAQVKYKLLSVGSKVKLTVEPYVEIDDKRNEILDFTFNQLNSLFGDKVLILFIPDIPTIRDNYLYMGAESYNHSVEQIVFYADKYNITFVDMTNTFVSYYDETLQFPFGFDNYRVGKGHLNEEGHKLIATKVVEQLTEII